MTVAGLLLAAGAGRRFGRPKALVEYAGRPLVERGARLLADGGCAPVVVVLGAAAPDVLARTGLDRRAGVEIAVADDWASGMGASLRAGLAHLAATPATAVIIALVDQPAVGPAAVRRLITSGAADAAVATYAGAPRNPVLLRREIWAEVAAAARGDLGARAWLRAHPDRVLAVPCDDTGSPADVDTPADLARLVAELRPRRAGGSPRPE